MCCRFAFVFLVLFAFTVYVLLQYVLGANVYCLKWSSFT